MKSLEISDASKEQSSINYYCEMREWKDKCREAEHRAEVYKRALHIAHTAGEFAYYVEKAEKELQEESKDE